jgi:hypothetical protein
MINRKAVALFVVLAAVPVLAAWSQYPAASATPVVDSTVVRTDLVAPSADVVVEASPVVVLVKKAPRKANRVAQATTFYPKRGWHQMDQGPVVRQVRDL